MRRVIAIAVLILAIGVVWLLANGGQVGSGLGGPVGPLIYPSDSP